jgi:hypothetical protein
MARWLIFMKTLTTQIPVTNTMANLNRWQILSVRDNEFLSPPSVEISLQFIGGNGKIYPYPQASFTLTAYDSINSTTIAVNANPVRFNDQLVPISVLISGAYTAITNALYGASGKAAIKTAVESAILSTGLLDANFS